MFQHFYVNQNNYKVTSVFVIVLILTSAIKPASMRKVSGFRKSDVLRIYCFLLHNTSFCMAVVSTLIFCRLHALLCMEFTLYFIW